MQQADMVNTTTLDLLTAQEAQARFATIPALTLFKDGPSFNPNTEIGDLTIADYPGFADSIPTTITPVFKDSDGNWTFIAQGDFPVCTAPSSTNVIGGIAAGNTAGELLVGVNFPTSVNMGYVGAAMSYTIVWAKGQYKVIISP